MADDRITIRKVTVDRREAWQRAAEADGRPLTSWLRHVADQAAASVNGAAKKPAKKPARRRRAKA